MAEEQLVESFRSIFKGTRIQAQEVNTLEQTVYFLQRHMTEFEHFLLSFVRIFKIVIVYLRQNPNRLDVLITLCQYLGMVAEEAERLFQSGENELLMFMHYGFELMSSIPMETDDDWLQGESDENSDNVQKIVEELTSSIAIVGGDIGFAAMLEITRQLTQPYWESQDWRHRHASIIFMAQCSYDGCPAEAVLSFLSYAQAHLEDPHPRVQCAALRLIELYVEEQSEIFTTTYRRQIFPMLLSILKNPAPKVIMHALSCLQEVIREEESVELFQDYIPTLKEAVAYFMGCKSYSMKQSAVSILSILAAFPFVFAEDSVEFYELVRRVIASHDPNGQFNYLINTSLVAMNNLVCFQSSLSNRLDEQLSIFLERVPFLTDINFAAIWSNLCGQYIQFMNLSSLYPVLISKIEIHTESFDSQMRSRLVQSLETTIRAFPTQFRPYLPSAYQLAKKIVNEAAIDWEAGCSLMAELVAFRQGRVEDMDLQMIVQDSGQFIMDKISKLNQRRQAASRDWQELQVYYSTAANIMPHLQGLIQQKQVFSIFQELFDAFDGVYCVTNPQNNAVRQLMEECLIEQAHLYKSLLSLLPSSLRTNCVAGMLLPQIQTQLCGDRTSLVFGLQCVCNVLEACSYDELREWWLSLNKVLLDYAVSQDILLRCTATSGLRVLIFKTPSQVISPESLQVWLDVINLAQKIPKKEEDGEAAASLFKEQATAALGKLLAVHSRAFPNILGPFVFQKWLEGLPLSSQMGDEQFEYIYDIFKTAPSRIVGDPKGVLRFLKMLRKFVENRTGLKHRRWIQMAKDCLRLVRSWSVFEQSIPLLQTGLTTFEKNLMNELAA